MLLINAKINTMDDNDTIYDNGFVEIKEGKIANIGDMKDCAKNQTGAVDLAGKMLYPGFIDPHSHIGMIGDSLGVESEDLNEDSDPITPHLRAIDGLNPRDRAFYDAYRNGVTTVITGVGSTNPIAGQQIAVKTKGIRVDDMVVKSPQSIKFALGENPKMTYMDKGETPTTRMATAALIREQLFKAKRYLEEKEAAKLDEDESEPEYDIKCEALMGLLKKEIKAHIHAHRADDIFTAIRLAKEFDFEYILVHATESYLIGEILAKEKAKVIIGPVINDRCKPELSNLTPKACKILSDQGVEFAICTDHPETPVEYIMLTCGVAVRNGLDRYKAIKSVTANAAKICDIYDRVGSLERGKDADICVFDSDALSIYEKARLVLIEGEVAFSDL